MEMLEELRTIQGDIRKPHWCITFRPDKNTAREIAVNGKMTRPEDGKALFILAKTGEFDCILGEIVNGDLNNMFILAKHNYCMK